MSGFGTVNCCHNVLANFIRHLLKFKIVHDVSFYHLYLCSSLKRPKQGHLVNIFQIAPTGTPLAIRVTLMPVGLMSLLIYMAVVSPSRLELVAIMTSSTSFFKAYHELLQTDIRRTYASMGEIAPPST